MSRRRASLFSALRRASTPALRFATVALFLLGTRAEGDPPPNQPASLLFWTGYEGSSAVDPATECSGRQCWQYFSGTDNSTGRAWRSSKHPASVGRFQLLADTPVEVSNIGSYMGNRVESGTGRNGSHALYGEIKRSGCCGTDGQFTGVAQNPYLLEPPASEQGDLYISYWLKFQPNLEALMGQCGPNIGYHWRSVFEFKTAGDYRVILVLQRDRDPKSCAFVGPLYWILGGDNNANCDMYVKKTPKPCPPPPTNLWRERNTSVPVVADQWFKLEVFWHRSSGEDGRVWAAAGGQVIADHHGPNTGSWNAPIDRIFTHLLYTSTAYPVFQRVDDLQIWQGFPTAKPDDPWYDPPYAPH